MVIKKKNTNLLSVLSVKQVTQKGFQWACLLSANGGVLWFSTANYVPCAQRMGSLKHGVVLRSTVFDVQFIVIAYYNTCNVKLHH